MVVVWGGVEILWCGVRVSCGVMWLWWWCDVVWWGVVWCGMILYGVVW